jgi:uncharacterized membrane protein YdcZ (DUF606 family)
MASSFFLVTPILLAERFHKQGWIVHCGMVLWFSVCSGLLGAVTLSLSVEVLEERTKATTQKAILSTRIMGA